MILATTSYFFRPTGFAISIAFIAQSAASSSCPARTASSAFAAIIFPMSIQRCHACPAETSSHTFGHLTSALPMSSASRSLKLIVSGQASLNSCITALENGCAVVTRARRAVDLSGLEFKLLRYFIERRGALLTRDELLEKVWGYDAMPVTRTVDVHVAALRQKIGAEHIITVHGLGYKFVG